MNSTRTHHLGRALMACTLAMLGHVGTAQASPRQALVATGVDADAVGHAKVNVRPRPSGLRGRLGVRGRKLDAGAVYQVTLDGVRIGSFPTSPGGAGKARFETNPNDNDQLLGVEKIASIRARR